MSSIYLLYRNILESGTITVTTENTDYPKWRLYDRDVGKLYKGTSTATHIIHIDQGASPIYDVDTLIIAAGHNLATATIQFQWSDNDADWNDAVTDFAAVAGQISKEAPSAITHRYWRVHIVSPPANPEIPEIFIGEKLELQAIVRWGYLDGQRGNVERTEALSGIPHFLQLGVDREYRSYSFRVYSSSVADAIDAFLLHSRYRGFWVKDLDSVWYFMSLLDPNVGPFGRPTIGIYDMEVELIEVPA